MRRAFLLLWVVSFSIALCNPGLAFAKDKKYGSWFVFSKRDRFTDARKVFAYSKATRAVTIRGRRTTPTLWARCDGEGYVDVFVDYGMFFECGESETIIRADSDDTISWNWECSTDCQATFWPSVVEDQTMSLLTYLSSKRILRIKSDPYLDSSVVSTFRLNGLKNALRDLQKSCAIDSSEQLEPLEFDDLFEEEEEE
jgi:hypothetical protein